MYKVVELCVEAVCIIKLEYLKCLNDTGKTSKTSRTGQAP